MVCLIHAHVASSSPPESPGPIRVRTNKRKKSRMVEDSDDELKDVEKGAGSSGSNLTTLIRESRKVVEKAKRDHAKFQKASTAAAAKKAGDRMLSHLQCTLCQAKDIEIATLKGKVQKLEEERAQRQQGMVILTFSEL